MTKIIPAALLLALLALCPSCLNPYLDPGPHPARISISFHTAVSPEQVQHTLEENQLIPPIVLPDLFHRVDGPFWDWGLYLVKEDGSLRPLPPAGKQATRHLQGPRLEAVGSFLAPPGRLHLKLLAECYLIHSWSEGMMPTQTQSLGVAELTRTWELDLKPGHTYRFQLSKIQAH